TCLTGYSSIDTDFNRFLYGYDKCGDTCGINNDPIKDVNCSGKDLTQKNFIFSVVYLFSIFCLFYCILHSRIASSRFIVLYSVCVVSRYWYVNDTNETQLLYIGVTSTIFHNDSVINRGNDCNFQDAAFTADIFDGKHNSLFENSYYYFICLFLIFNTVTIITLIVLLILLTAIIFLSALISTNADLVELEEDPSTHEYNISATGLACLTFLLITVLWLFAFTNGCQCMIIAGAVAANYFKRKQSLLSAAPFTSIYVLIRYHLGTVAFGSLVITMVMFARISVEFLRHHSKFKNLVRFLECCLAFLQEFVDYLTKRAYIQTAMHGKPLYQSGVRAARLLWSNLMDTISLDVVGDFIVFCALIFVMLVATAVGISISFVAIETMFLCFCEDKLMNDGKDREYFMSPELLAIVNKAKEAAKQ
ncbi:choline transporter-like protein 2, partial [Asbolus verrucosus]